MVDWGQTSTGCPKKSDPQKKIVTKIEYCGAKLSHGHGLGALDPAVALETTKKQFLDTAGWGYWQLVIEPVHRGSSIML